MIWKPSSTHLTWKTKQQAPNLLIGIMASPLFQRYPQYHDLRKMSLLFSHETSLRWTIRAGVLLYFMWPFMDPGSFLSCYCCAFLKALSSFTWCSCDAVHGKGNRSSLGPVAWRWCRRSTCHYHSHPIGPNIVMDLTFIASYRGPGKCRQNQEMPVIKFCFYGRRNTWILVNSHECLPKEDYK